MSVSLLTCRAAVAVSMLAVAALSWAAEPLVLAEAQRLAVDRSGQLRAHHLLAAAAREQAVAAGQLPDPVLRLGIDNLPASGPDRGSLGSDFMTMRRIGIMQELPRAEKRLLRAERFERDAQMGEAGAEQTLATLRRDTALAWLDGRFSQALSGLLARQLDETRLQVQAAEVAFRTGRGSQADVFAARAAVAGVQDRLNQADQQARSAALMLARWVGPEAAGRALSGPSPWENQAAPWQGRVPGGGIDRHPDLRLLRAELDAAETEARLAQADQQADWSVEASYSQRGPGYSNMVSIGVSVPLQWRPQERQNRELAARLARVEAVKARYEDLRRSREADVQILSGDWQSASHRLARQRDQLIPALHLRAEAALATYRAGKADLGTTLAARRDEVEAQILALSLEKEAARLWAQLQFLFPDLPSPTAANTATAPRKMP